MAIDLLEDAGRRVDEILAIRGLADDPAFAETAYVISPIACDAQCPLAMYDPEKNTIYLVPLFSEDSLLHELGHRWNHFYKNKPYSEEAAEMFRLAHRDSKELVAEGTPEELWLLDRAETMFEGGEGALLEVYLDRAATSADAQMVENELRAAGIDVRGVDTLGNRLRVRVNRAPGANLLPIFFLLGTIAVLGITGAVSWSLFRIGTEVKNKLIPLALIAGGIFLLYALIKQPRATRA